LGKQQGGNREQQRPPGSKASIWLDEPYIINGSEMSRFLLGAYALQARLTS
jgi:hypothetical protein